MVKQVFLNKLFDLIETSTGALRKAADDDLLYDITVIVCDGKVTLVYDEGMRVIDAIYSSAIVRGGGREVIKCFVDLHHQAVLFFRRTSK